MKRCFLLAVALVFGFSLAAQNLKPNLKAEKAIVTQRISAEPQNTTTVGKSHQANLDYTLKGTDVVTVIDIGTSANAYGYGLAGGQKSLVNVNNDLNMVTNIHRMGGDLDPGGYSGDMGYDVSVDGGITWNNMVEVYVATENAGGEYYIDAIRYPAHGVYNPAGNTDPDNAYLAFFAPNLDGTNSIDQWGGYSYGVHKIGSASNVDTTKNRISSDPDNGKFQYIPDGYCMVNANAEYWVADLNQDWSSDDLVWLNEMIITHGIWNEDIMDFEIEQMIMDCETTELASRPVMQKVEFSPDGQIGYIVVLSDNGEVEISANRSYYPILWRTEDGGQTWSDPIEVALAGDDGIAEVHAYLTDEEIAALYEEPIPERDAIEFTTAFDFDLSVDMYGNPVIAVMVGVTGTEEYSILTAISAPSGYALFSAFMLHSTDKGEPGSWYGHELGRPVSFRGNFGALTEDNRIQIARTPAGDKMFAAWLDTDTTVSPENNAPDIWCRGIDLLTNTLTVDANGEDKPANVTFGSEGTFSSYFFAMGNEVLDDGAGNYTIPFVFENMTPTDPGQPVKFKYIQDFKFTDADFISVAVEESERVQAKLAEVSQSVPNPATNNTKFKVTLQQNTLVNVQVTNLMGQIVKVLPSQNMQAGVNAVSINVADLTPGVYFYTVEAGTTAVTRKMIVK